MGRIKENSPAHGLHAVRFLFGRLAGDDAVLIDEQAVIDDTVDIPFVGYDQGMITLPCPAGTDKTGNMHRSSSFLSCLHRIRTGYTFPACTCGYVSISCTHSPSTA